MPYGKTYTMRAISLTAVRSPFHALPFDHNGHPVIADIVSFRKKQQQGRTADTI